MASRKSIKNKVDPHESWHTLQAVIHGMTEPDLEKFIEDEIAEKNRRNMVMRAHMKLNKLRYAREKAVLVKRTKEPNRHAATKANNG